MKIVTVGYLHGNGGAERQIIMLSNELAIRGHNVYLVVLGANKAPYMINPNVILYDLTYVEQGKMKILKRYMAFRSIVKKIQPDVTINFNLQSAYFGLFIGKNWSGKILYSERGDPYDKEYSGLLGVVRDMAVKYIDAFVFQSEGAKNFFKLHKGQKSIIIQNPVCIPPNKYIIPNKRDKRIVSVGRYHRQKNQILLIKSFAEIASEFPEYTLEIYGDGDMKKELNEKISELRLCNRIFLLPPRNDLFDHIRIASLFVLSSDFEGMPNSLMEAMALGLPSISTDCRPGGARALIQNGENGIIVPRNNISALSNAMRYMLNHKDIAEKMAKKAMNITYSHSSEMTYRRWEEFLYNVINN